MHNTKDKTLSLVSAFINHSGKIRLIMMCLVMLFALSFFVKEVRAEETTAQEETTVQEETTEEESTQEETTTQQETTQAETYATNEVSKKTVKYGFVKKNGKTYYYLMNGKRAVGFKTINKKRYYFNKNGVMVKGFKIIKKKKYYFRKNGVMVTGFKKIKKKRYYFKKNGVMVKGFKTINKKRYYFKKSGAMAKGFQKIKKKKYYFKKNGVMAKGLVKIKKSKYYFNAKGVMQHGLKRIKKAKYYFRKNGKMFKGFLWRKVKKKKIWNYFGKNGKLKTGKFRLGKVVYKATKKGSIYFINNLAPVVCQRPQLPTGCEITAWTMMVKHEGKKMNKIRAARIMPRSGNPNYGFVGSPFSNSGHVLVVYPNGLAGITKRHLGKYKNMTGCSLSDIRSKLRKKHLVLVWLVALNGFGSHTVTLTGYDRHHFYYNNPWTGRREKMRYSRFKWMWYGNAARALSY